MQDVRDMVTRDRSRPSVIIWGTRLNETADFPSLWAQTRAAAELDATRPSSGAMDLYGTRAGTRTSSRSTITASTRRQATHCSGRRFPGCRT